MPEHGPITPPESSLPAFSLSRRRLLGATCVGAAAGALLLNPAWQAWAKLASQDTAGLATLMTLSQQLTGRNDLDARIGQRLYEALAQRDAALGQNLSELQARLGEAPQGWSERQQQLARQILAGWYLGLIGDEHNVKVVTYEHALMFKAVEDVLVIRSYCPNQPGFWAARPVERRA